MTTSVEWFYKEINKLSMGNDAKIFIIRLFKEAKEKNKKEIIDAYLKGYLEDIPRPSAMHYYEDMAEQYYNETFDK